MEDIDAYRDILKDVQRRLKEDYIHTETYKQEFDQLKTHSDGLMVTQTRHDGWLQYNRNKNRYKDILPYDRTRVRLPTINNIAGSDYINASHISGPAGYVNYIAAQGPLSNTIFDFWRMVWYNHVTVIVMVCREFELGKDKCKNYWGKAAGDTQKWGNFNVQLVSEKDEEQFVVRKLVLNCAEVSREVYQYQYLDWPDRGVPLDGDPLNAMLAMVRDTCPEKMSSNNVGTPIVIHCSAGCGRTGTVLGIDYIDTLIKQHKLSREFSLYEMVKGMRIERVAICQTKQQYGFVYYTAIQLLDAAIETLNLRSETVTETIYENVPISPLLNESPVEEEQPANKYSLSNSKSSPPIKPPKPEKPKSNTSASEMLHKVEYTDQENVVLMSGYTSMDLLTTTPDSYVPQEKTNLKLLLMDEEQAANKPSLSKPSPPTKPPKPEKPKPTTPAAEIFHKEEHTAGAGSLNLLGISQSDEPLYAAINPGTRVAVAKLIDIDDSDTEAPPLPASPTYDSDNEIEPVVGKVVPTAPDSPEDDVYESAYSVFIPRANTSDELKKKRKTMKSNISSIGQVTRSFSLTRKEKQPVGGRRPMSEPMDYGPPTITTTAPVRLPGPSPATHSVPRSPVPIRGLKTPSPSSPASTRSFSDVVHSPTTRRENITSMSSYVNSSDCASNSSYDNNMPSAYEEIHLPLKGNLLDLSFSEDDIIKSSCFLPPSDNTQSKPLTEPLFVEEFLAPQPFPGPTASPPIPVSSPRDPCDPLKLSPKLNRQDSSDPPPPLPRKKKLSTIQSSYSEAAIPVNVPVKFAEQPDTEPQDHIYSDMSCSDVMTSSPDREIESQYVELAGATTERIVYTDVVPLLQEEYCHVAIHSTVLNNQDLVSPSKLESKPSKPAPFRDNPSLLAVLQDIIERERNRLSLAPRFDDDNNSELSLPHSDITDSQNLHEQSSTEDVEDDDEDMYETFDTSFESKTSKDNSLQKGVDNVMSKKFSIGGKKLKPKGFGFKGLIANMSDSAHTATQNLKQRSNIRTHTNTNTSHATTPHTLPQFNYVSEFGKRTGKPRGPREMPEHWLKI